jgi:hypothetical protein
MAEKYNESPPPKENTIIVSDKMLSLIKYIEEKKYGTITLDFYNGDPTILRRTEYKVKL